MKPFRLVLIIYQSVVLALVQIWSSKLRSLLTTTGIVIGVASVTAVIAALTGLQTRVLGEFESLGSNTMWIFPRRPDSGPARQAPQSAIAFRPEFFDDLLKNAPNVKYLSRLTSVQYTIRYEDKVEENVSVSGIEADWHKIQNRYVTLGRPLSVLDNEQSRPVCIIDKKLQTRLALPADPVGSYISMGSRRFLIIGLIEEKTGGGLLPSDQISDAEVFVPFTTAYNARKAITAFPFLYVMAASVTPQAAEDAQSEITFHLRKVRKLRPGDQNTFQVEFVARLVDQINKLAYVVTAVATGIVGISLLVGGVGIMNIMLVSVSERTREIGLRKAIGARPSTILLQFLIEAVVLCLLGGLVGLSIGYAFAKGLAAIPGLGMSSAYVPAWAVVLAFGFSASVGLIFGMFPAIKAARLDPIDALRHE